MNNDTNERSFAKIGKRLGSFASASPSIAGVELKPGPFQELCPSFS
jgi:hypothetical protein